MRARRVIVIVCCVVGLTAVYSARGQDRVSTGAPINREQRLQWFREAKFGMFIHWGLYSVLGGEWRGMRTRGNVEMIMEGSRIPLAQYREVARQFNPVEFDAQRWVSLAKRSGMKYMVITAKHQDGFATYHSRVSKYNIVDATPFKRDPLEELAVACRREGIRFCVYYSQRDDYEDPNSYGNYWDFHEPDRDFEKYFDGKVKPQLRELLTGYGPIGLVWFDHGLYTPQQANEIVDLVHGLQPRCLVNGRVGNYGQELMGDYQSLTDHGLPSSGMQEYFEALQTLNRSWGYSKFDGEWKSPGVVIRQLIDAVSKGGNYLLDVGPTALGTIPQPAADILEKVGAWLRVNGESIYGTSASPFLELPWGRCTVKGEKLYLHIFDWPHDGVLLLSGLRNEVTKAYLLLDRSHTLELTRDGDRLAIRLPGKPADEDDTVIVLEIAGKPEVAPPVVLQKGSSPIVLDYVTAITTGRAIKRFNRVGNYHISKWVDPQDSISWSIRISEAHRYQVWIAYAAQKEWGGGEYQVSIGSTSLPATVVDTRAYSEECFGPGSPCERPYHYMTFNVGVVDLSRAGQYDLKIRPASAVGHDLMYFKSITLTPLR